MFRLDFWCCLQCFRLRHCLTVQSRLILNSQTSFSLFLSECQDSTVVPSCSICSLYVCFIRQEEVIYGQLLSTENIPQGKNAPLECQELILMASSIQPYGLLPVTLFLTNLFLEIHTRNTISDTYKRMLKTTRNSNVCSSQDFSQIFQGTCKSLCVVNANVLRKAMEFSLLTSANYSLPREVFLRQRRRELAALAQK